MSLGKVKQTEKNKDDEDKKSKSNDSTPRSKKRRAFNIFGYLILYIFFIFINFIFFSFLTFKFIFKEKTLPYTKTYYFNASFEDEAYLKKSFFDNFNALDVYTLVIDGQMRNVTLSDLELELDTQSLIKSGKKNPVDFSVQLIKNIAGKKQDLPYSFNVKNVTSKFPFAVSSEGAAYVEGTTLIGCETNVFDVSIDEQKLGMYLSEEIRKRNPIVEISTENYIHDENDIIAKCRNYNKDLVSVAKLNETLTGDSNILESNIFSFDVESNHFILSDEASLKENITSYKTKNDVKPTEGRYEVLGDKILLFDNYKVGKSLDIDKNVNLIKEWLVNPKSDYEFAFDDVSPKVTTLGMQIMDFTLEAGVGATRMHMVYDNSIGQAANARVGFDELHNTILMPGETFSFFNHIKPVGADNAYTTKGNFIGIGICTPVTTLFRSVLDSGLPIVERYNHAEHVKKYRWNPVGDPNGYALVDATFYAVPGAITDFKFKNDYSSPILIRSEVWYEDGYQMHRSIIRTAAKEKKRNVTLSNWSTWDIWGPSSFKTNFDRTVYIDGKIMFSDSFFSQYTWGYD